MSYTDSPSHRLRHVELREVELESQQPYSPANHPPTPQSSSSPSSTSLPKYNPQVDDSRIVNRCPDTLCQISILSVVAIGCIYVLYQIVVIVYYWMVFTDPI